MRINGHQSTVAGSHHELVAQLRINGHQSTVAGSLHESVAQLRINAINAQWLAHCSSQLDFTQGNHSLRP